MDRPPFGLLLITGNHTHQENYARAFAADPRCRLIGLTDDSDVSPWRKEHNRALAEELDIPYLDDWKAAVARDDVDLVSICAEPERRGALTVACAQAGRHVYLDKEPDVTLSGLRSVSGAIEESGVLNQAFSLVRTSVAQRAKQIVESGRLGTLVGLHCEMLFAKGIPGSADLSQPRREKPQAERFTFLDSKRELLCVGYYPLVLFQWLTGRRFETVSGTTSNYFFAQHQRNQVEDFSCIMLQMQGGIEATITAGRSGWSSHPSHGIHQIHLVGTSDSVTLDAYKPRLEVASDARPWRQPETPHPEDPMGFWTSTQQAGGVIPKTHWWPVEDSVRSDAAHFLDCLENQRPSDVPVGTATHAVEVVLAAYRAAANREEVEIVAASSP